MRRPIPKGSLFGTVAPIDGMTTSALLVTAGSSRKQLHNLAPGPISEIYEAGPTKVGSVLDLVGRDATRGKFRALVLPTLKVGTGTRTLLRFLAILADLEVEVLSAQEPWFRLDSKQAELVRLLHTILTEERKSSIQNGIARARRAGRSPGRPALIVPPEVFELADQGLSLRAIARTTGISSSSVGRALAARRVLHPHPQASDSGEVV